MKVLVIGGTLFIGRTLVKSLQQAGHDVSIMHRRPDHDLGRKVGNVVADRNDPAEVKRALADQRFEVVFDNAYDWQRGTTAAHVEATARACGDHLHRYVFMSSVAAYGDGLNHHEGDALAPDDHPDSYVRNKAMSERALFRLHQRYGIPAVTLRPPYVYGPGNPFYREAFFWDRLREGRPIIMPGDGRRLMQFVFVKDLVWACTKVIEAEAAAGHAFNIANPRPVTQTEVVQALAEAAGRQPMLVRIPRERILRMGGNPIIPPLYFGAYFDMPAITQVISKA
ncbi:MAG: NAD-dependent epimerase/dehydratase family protein, partial [Acidobacteria bacterium]|nr:NAD-dependent epimerase/dehydratase family protein [Acidobacteriota bacterium]